MYVMQCNAQCYNLEIHIDVAQKWAWLRPSQGVGLPGCELALLRWHARSQDFDTAMAHHSACVPAALLEQLNKCRPECFWYSNYGRCRKGNNCPCRHVRAGEIADEENDSRLPYMSIHRNDDGNISCVIRAPMPDAFKYLFKQHRVPQRVA